jgi:hypothetical protein
MSRVDDVQGQASCEVCGKSQDRCFEVLLGGEKHVFDSFECAMHAMTPKCALCGFQILGHGVHVENALYCSYQCANLFSSSEYESRVMLRERANP